MKKSSGQTKDISTLPAPTETEPLSDVETLKAITVSCRTQHTLAHSLFHLTVACAYAPIRSLLATPDITGHRAYSAVAICDAHIDLNDLKPR